MAIYVRKPDGSYEDLPLTYSDIQNNSDKLLMSTGSDVVWTDPNVTIVGDNVGLAKDSTLTNTTFKTSIEVDNAGLAKDTTVNNVITTLKNLKGVKYVVSNASSVSVDAASTVTLIDTGYLGKLIKIIALSWGADYSKVKAYVYVYNADGTSTGISFTQSDDLVVNSIRLETLTQNNISKMSNIWRLDSYDTTNNYYSASLNQGVEIYCYGVKIEVTNYDTANAHYAGAILVYAELE